MVQKVSKLTLNYSLKYLETKAFDNSKVLMITKRPNIQKPMLKLWDYLNRVQQDKHELVCKQKDMSKKLNAKDNLEEFNVIIIRNM